MNDKYLITSESETLSKEAGVAWFELLSRYLCDGTEDKYEEPGRSLWVGI